MGVSRKKLRLRWFALGVVLFAGLAAAASLFLTPTLESRASDLQLGQTEAETLSVMGKADLDWPLGHPKFPKVSYYATAHSRAAVQFAGWWYRMTGTPLDWSADWRVQLHFDGHGRLCRIRRGDEIVQSPSS
jgi:hypothetical protein